MLRKAATTLAVLLVFGAASAADAAEPFATKKNASFAASQPAQKTSNVGMMMRSGENGRSARRSVICGGVRSATRLRLFAVKCRRSSHPCALRWRRRNS